MTLKVGGKKFSGKHTTYIDAAENAVKFLMKDERVKKISLGIITSCSGGRSARAVKSKKIAAGVEIKIRGNLYMQVIRAYLYEPMKNSESISEEIEKIFEN